MLNDFRNAMPPDADVAERRAWATTAEAFAERNRAPRTLLGRLGVGYRPQVGPAARAALVIAVAAAVTVLAFTPPGDAVADFVRRVVDPPPAATPRAERPVAVPGPGRMLVISEDGLSVAGRDGTGPSLGRWDGATWSPNARFIGAWLGNELTALAPDGSRRWTLHAPAPLLAARWSPEGFHVAYLLAGPTRTDLRIIAGNGQRDRLWRAGVAPVTPAFRPNARRTLAWVRPDGRVPVGDVFTGQIRALSGPRLGRGATAIAWTGDGRRLAVLARDELLVWNVQRKTVRTIALDGRGEAVAASPRGTRLAVLTYDARRGVSTVTLPRNGATIRVRGHLRDLTFSPDGRTLLATWPTHRQWLVLGAGGTLDATTAARGAPGRIAGWCC